MWLLENAGNSLQGRQLWLRPGKRYLFGRTRAEPGQLVIADKTISRKHLTIEVGRVPNGDGMDRRSRSVVTIEDLNTKIGTVVNGTQIRGQRLVLAKDSNEIKMGHLADLFSITWRPIVLSFSFTTKELRADQWARLSSELEQLDVKYIADYDIAQTTHVVAKKRNTSKGLQALVNGKYIVTESFISAIEQAAAESSSGPSLLEQDFGRNWPDPLDYLPPRGDEPSDRPVSTYGPDSRRNEIFSGYTFIFYDQKQYDTLFPPISNGKGKALLIEVDPGRTEVDDFVRSVKGVAGETSLGEFEDGSMGKGVVVVRYLPAKGDYVDWFSRFSTAVSLRLDHRLVDQREFLDAILAVEPSMLRRPLEEDTEAATAIPAPSTAEQARNKVSATTSTQVAASPSSTPARRPRRGLTSRFKGFDVDLDPDNEPSILFATTESVPDPEPEPEPVEAGETGLFMSQTAIPEEPAAASKSSGRDARANKRAATALLLDAHDDVMDDIAPTAAAVKRRRIESGTDPLPPRPSPDEIVDEDEGAVEDATKALAAAKGRVKNAKESAKENAILELARKNREAAEKRAAEERERLAQVPDDGVDALEIRAMTIVEEMPMRTAATAARTREQDVADGRWDPRWNGRRNFKKFRKQGDPVGRPRQRVLVGLEPAKTKEYGLSDDYWLEGGDGGEDSGSWKTAPQNSGRQQRIVPGTLSTVLSGERSGERSGGAAPTFPAIGTSSPEPEVVDLDIVPDTEPEDGPGLSRPHAGSDSENEHEAAAAAPSEQSYTPAVAEDMPRTRAGKTAQKTAARQSQTRTRTTRGGTVATLDTQSSLDMTLTSGPTERTQSSTARGKRTAAATASGSRASPAKRPRRGAGVGAIMARESDSDDDDGLQFKFRGRR